MQEIILSINDLNFAFGEKQIFRKLSLQVKEGEIVTLLGNSGKGKSTLFNLISGSLTPLDGSIKMCRKQQGVSHMTQDDLLLPWRTVAENLSLCRELGKNKRQLCHAKALEEVQLQGYENYYPDQLSAGIRKRVSLAMILLQKRPLLLLDEPFAPLDVALREHIYHLLRCINKKENNTIIFVSHDFHDALALSHRILLLDQGCITKEWDVPEHNKLDLLPQLRQALTE